jgi:hypothetical protein
LVLYDVVGSAISISLGIGLPAILAIGFLYRLHKAKKDKKPLKEEARKYVGRALTRFDPITGAPINVLDKAAVVEYVEDHFEGRRSDETGIYGKDREDY